MNEKRNKKKYIKEIDMLLTPQVFQTEQVQIRSLTKSIKQE